MYAFRNIALCAKDCLCLYVCPTGAADTETGQIDVFRCIGCGACAQACPSGAISMVPGKYPPPQPKEEIVKEAVRRLAKSKSKQEKEAAQLAAGATDPVLCLLAGAVAQSSRIMAEDLWRESGFMLPQSPGTRELLEALLQFEADGFPAGAVKQLLKEIERREKEEKE